METDPLFIKIENMLWQLWDLDIVWMPINETVLYIQFRDSMLTKLKDTNEKI